MRKIILLTDYQGRFSSKMPTVPYMSGMDKDLLKNEFIKRGCTVEYLNYPDLDFRNGDYKKAFVLYTSSEDDDLFYKSYIEDIIFGLELQGAYTIPSFKYLKAHHNKVFMEILRDQSNLQKIKNIKSLYFGTFEDLSNYKGLLEFPGVFKSAQGSTSTGVRKINSKREAAKYAKHFSRTRNIKYELWDLGRSFKYKAYKRESLFRRKFVLQNFIMNLDKDWKVLIFGNKYFILERRVRENDFRASGSGLFRFTANIPDGILDYAKEFYESENVPFLSMDIGFDGNSFYLMEFQALYFGTVTLQKSPFYFENEDIKWNIVHETSVLENVFAEAVVNYINTKIK